MNIKIITSMMKYAFVDHHFASVMQVVIWVIDVLAICSHPGRVASTGLHTGHTAHMCTVAHCVSVSAGKCLDGAASHRSYTTHTRHNKLFHNIITSLLRLCGGSSSRLICMKLIMSI